LHCTYDTGTGFIRSGDFKFSDSRESMSMFEVESLIQFYELANFYHLLLCVLRVRAS